MENTHRDRLKQTLSGDKPDRPPIAFWHHFPVDDQDPFRLAAATIAFQKQFDFDLVKVSPPSSFCLKDWGVQDQWIGSDEGTREYTKRVINDPADWFNLRVLDPYKGYLGQQLACLKELSTVFGDHTPYIQTIFNPLSQAKNLVGPQNLLTHIRKYPEAIHHGLRTIQETTIRFVQAAKTLGISGIFFAIQHASYRIMTEQEYADFGKHYDLPVLQDVGDLWANMVHLHGNDIMFNLIADYHVQMMNWHDRETPPALSDALKIFPRTLCGGLSRIDTMVLGSTEQIHEEIRQAVEITGGKRLLISTGCVLPQTAPYGNIMAARKFIEELH